ncbi:MAG: hypothetical protein KDB00_20055, partial [Planctomycetales bacterium]|nr:hypothetical protein [Planctomycetales bacterium]
MDPHESCRLLNQCTEPFLIGVRHHSAMLAKAMSTLLDRAAPEKILVELPSDLSDWIRHIADPQTKTPVAISAVNPNGGMWFYPLADFSPEYAAIRWAYDNNVPVVACDLSVSATSTLPPFFGDHGPCGQSPDVLTAMKRRTGATDV